MFARFASPVALGAALALTPLSSHADEEARLDPRSGHALPAPVIAGGLVLEWRVHAATEDPLQRTPPYLQLVAHRSGDPEITWACGSEHPNLHPAGPLVLGDRVLFCTDYGLRAVDLHTGKIVWTPERWQPGEDDGLRQALARAGGIVGMRLDLSTPPEWRPIVWLTPLFGDDDIPVDLAAHQIIEPSPATAGEAGTPAPSVDQIAGLVAQLDSVIPARREAARTVLDTSCAWGRRTDLQRRARAAQFAAVVELSDPVSRSVEEHGVGAILASYASVVSILHGARESHPETLRIDLSTRERGFRSPPPPDAERIPTQAGARCVILFDLPEPGWDPAFPPTILLRGIWRADAPEARLLTYLLSRPSADAPPPPSAPE